jgi:hypothetical protein
MKDGNVGAIAMTKHSNPAKQKKIDDYCKKNLTPSEKEEKRIDMIEDLQGALLESHLDEAMATDGHEKVK